MAELVSQIDDATPRNLWELALPFLRDMASRFANDLEEAF